MYARLVNKLPEGEDWLYEVKFDGYYCRAGTLPKGLSFFAKLARSEADPTNHSPFLTMVVTSPVLTAFSIALLPEQVKAAESERFISEVGTLVGGLGLKLAVVLTASSLLLFAANTAIIGAYHIFLALVSGCSNFPTSDILQAPTHGFSGCLWLVYALYCC